jgi:hypothetical protein
LCQPLSSSPFSLSSHFIAFPRHVQFGEYIKGGSRLFPLRLAITLFAREQAPKPNSSKPGCSGCLLSALSSIRSIAAKFTLDA